jgi:O-antigen biosynthesis protein
MSGSGPTSMSSADEASRQSTGSRETDSRDDADADLPSLSVVIATRNRPAVLDACLDASARQDYPALELIVIDSAPRIAADEVSVRRGARYRRLDLPGASRARNHGARMAGGEVVLFLDDDAVPQPGCFRMIVSGFRDARIMVVTGRTVLAAQDARTDAAFEASGGFDPGPTGRVVDAATPGWFELVNFGGLGAGAVMAFRRVAFDRWPGFDERLGRGAPQDCNEEPCAYLAMVEQGYRVAYVPEAVVTHPGPASLEDLRCRHLHDAAWASAYMCLLLLERPRHRKAVMAYALGALRGTQRSWRARPARARHRVVPRWQERIAWLLGPALYLRMRLIVALRGTGPSWASR